MCGRNDERDEILIQIRDEVEYQRYTRVAPPASLDGTWRFAFVNDDEYDAPFEEYWEMTINGTEFGWESQNDPNDEPGWLYRYSGEYRSCGVVY